ncbi:MAG: hypothetical protein LBI90_05320 [Treponema sp.]|nr:hypothetical protein [Treponema sp.]
MKTPGKRYLRLLVLLPHRDTRRELEVWSAKLFAGGFDGAWSFPHVCPLAILSRPFSRDERKEAARRFREIVCAGDKFHSGPVEVLNLADGLSVFGPEMTLDLSEDLKKMKDALNINSGAGKILRIAPRFVLGCGLAGKEDSIAGKAIPGLPSLHFRTAALANMSLDPLEGEFSFRWEIGELSWLPSARAGFRRGEESPRKSGEPGFETGPIDILKKPRIIDQ